MGFAMRMDFVDVVVDDSLKNVKVNGKNIGYQFDIRLSYYRGHFLSVIDEFGVKVDGKEVPAETIKFCINGKEFSPIEFDKCYTEFWQVIGARSSARFLLSETPVFSFWITMTLGSWSPYSSHMSPEASVLPSLTNSSSKSVYSWFKMLSTQRRK